MTFFNSVMAGVGIGFSVVMVIGIADGLSTYIFNGETLSSKVKGRVGNGGSKA
jgi:hypothetical protein